MRVFEFITGHVIYNPAYTYKFQLKTNHHINTCPRIFRPSSGSDIVYRIIRQDNSLLMIAFGEVRYKIEIEL